MGKLCVSPLNTPLIAHQSAGHPPSLLLPYSTSLGLIKLCHHEAGEWSLLLRRLPGTLGGRLLSGLQATSQQLLAHLRNWMPQQLDACAIECCNNHRLSQ